MLHYLNSEKANMLFMYGCANGITTEAVRFYRMHFPKKAIPNLKTFQRLPWKISKTSLLYGERQDAGILQTTRNDQLSRGNPGDSEHPT